jgi:hypothetical protein
MLTPGGNSGGRKMQDRILPDGNPFHGTFKPSTFIDPYSLPGSPRGRQQTWVDFQSFAVLVITVFIRNPLLRIESASKKADRTVPTVRQDLRQKRQRKAKRENVLPHLQASKVSI